MPASRSVTPPSSLTPAGSTEYRVTALYEPAGLWSGFVVNRGSLGGVGVELGD